jgi:hypothetical protein
MEVSIFLSVTDEQIDKRISKDLKDAVNQPI